MYFRDTVSEEHTACGPVLLAHTSGVSLRYLHWHLYIHGEVLQNQIVYIGGRDL